MAAVGSAGLKVDASGATVPVSVAATVNVRQSDGTNPVTKTFDLDTGAGTEYNLGVGLRKAASGGSVEAGTSSDPLRIDPTGTTSQPVSGTITANLGTIAGVATAAKQPALGTAGTASADVITIQGIASMTAVKVDGSAVTQPVSGTIAATQSGTWTVQPGNTANTTAWKVDGSAVTQPISAASLPLPTGAATSAKQPALGTAGTASADVITVQGIASMTAVKVDGSGVTQPVSGTVTANQGGTWTVQPGNTANTTPWLVQSVPATSGGLGFPFSASLTSTKQAVKASAGMLYGYEIVNNGSAECYIQVFNKTTANVTVGTTAPDFVIPVPAPSSGTNGAGIVHDIDKGVAFSTAITIACTTTRTGSTSATCDVNFFFD